MCGIYGFQVSKEHELSIYETTVVSMTLASQMESRGKDSFGGISIPSLNTDVDGKIRVMRGLGKVTESGSQLLKMASSSRCFLGHTRTATRGEVSIPNAHPFNIGDILGVHNGVVYNHDEMNRRYGRSFEVDSMHVFAHIDENKPLGELLGYGTFFWTRKSEKWEKIYLAKTVAGALSIARFFRDEEALVNDNHFMLAWASEFAALQKVASILGVVFRPISVVPEKIHYIQDSILYIHDDQTFELGYSTKSINNGGHFRHPYSLIEEGDDDENFSMGGGGKIHKIPNLSGVEGMRQDNTSECLLNTSRQEKRLSRKKRKALLKQQAKQKIAAKKREWVLDPITENISAGMFLRFIYLPRNGHSGEADKHYLCPQCECLLDEHIWGWCPHNGDKTRNCKAGEINVACDVPIASLCSDCGHHLIEGIHREAPAVLYKVVECTVCNQFCAPEATLLNQPDEEDIVEAEPAVEAEVKGGELILASESASNLIISLSLEERKEEQRKAMLEKINEPL